MGTGTDSTEAPTTEQGLALLLQRLGLPSSFNGLSEADRARYRETVLAASPADAYAVGRALEDKVLMEQAREPFANASPLQAAAVGMNVHDSALRKIAGRKLLEGGHPVLAYEIGQDSVDDALISAARQALVVKSPSLAYHLGKKANDVTLRRMAGWRLLDDYPDLAYQAGQGDNSGFGQQYAPDIKLIAAAGWKLLSLSPDLAYTAGRVANDPALIERARA